VNNIPKVVAQLLWRNINVAAINAGLHQRVFSLKPGENWWSPDQKGTFYGFPFAPSIGAVTQVRDIGWDELAFETVLCPKSLQAQLLDRWQCDEPGVWSWIWEHYLGKAMGWLERREGAWLQDLADPRGWAFTCHSITVGAVLGARQRPRGYADHGRCM